MSTLRLAAVPLLFVGLLFLGPRPALGETPDVDTADILATLTEQLELTDEQVPQVATALQDFAKAMDAATAPAADEEPDHQKMIGDIKKARSDFRGSMEKTLTKEQYAKFDAGVDQVFQGMFEDIAAIQIMDLQPVLALTDEQATALAPVMGTALRNVVATLFEYGDKKLRAPTKIKLGKHLKGIQSDMKNGMSAILSPEQMQQYEAYVAAKKEKQKEK